MSGNNEKLFMKRAVQMIPETVSEMYLEFTVMTFTCFTHDDYLHILLDCE